MERQEAEQLGRLVQCYVRQKAGAIGRDGSGSIQERSSLDERLRHRIDLLGLDAERLLAVKPDVVLTELELLEQEAALEDAGVRPEVAKVRAREELRINDQTRTPLRTPRGNRKRHREPA